MSLKSKLITTISMFVLVLVMTIVGVFAVTSATVNMGGNITFVADDVYARITGKIEGANESTNLAVLNYTATSEPSAEDLSTWINDLTFKSATESIKITVTVENLAQGRWLLVNIEDQIASPITNLIRKMEKGGQAYTSGTNHALAPSTGEGTSKVEFVLTLSVENGNYSITDASYDYIIHLNNSNDEPEQPAEELEFTFDGNKVTGYTGTETNIRIPSSYSIQETEATEFIVTLDDFNGNTPEGRNKVGILMALSGYTLHLSNGNTIICSEGFYSIQDNIDEIQRNLPMTVDLTGVDLTFTVGVEGPTQGQEQALGGFLQGYWYKQATDSDWVDSSVTPLPETLNYPVEFKVNVKTYKYFEGNDYTVDTISMFSLPQSGTDTIVLTIPSTIKNIDPYAFQSDTTSFSLVFEDRTELPVIGEGAFAGCSGLKSVILPNSLKGFVENVFDNCSNLEFNTYDNAYYLGNETNPYLVLYKAINTSVSSVQINESCKIIGDNAFNSCSSLTSITFEGNSQLITIGNRAFRFSGLKSIGIPEWVTTIGDSAFANCNLLESVIIPTGVTTIGGYAFQGCTKLTSIAIPEGVTMIGESTFGYCNGLTSIVIPERVTSIGNFAFSGCSGLTEIIFNGNSQLQTIGESAFSSCSGLVSITLPEGVTEIGNDAFKYCTSLTSLTINAIEPPTLGTSVFHSNLATIYVPSGSVGKYQTAWADYSSKIQAIPEP